MVKTQELVEWVSLNVVGVLGFITVVKEYLPWGVGLVGSCILIWYNIERALKVRAERKKIEDEAKEEIDQNS